jgi:hypothetical protein
MQTRPKPNKIEAVLDALRPSPTEFSGFVTGGLIGAYVASPVGALGGMFIGGTLFYLAERAIDRSAASGHKPAPH